MASSLDLAHNPPPSNWVLSRVEMMAACYRREDAMNPEMYCAAIAAVLSDYPAEVIEKVTDPRTGLPRQIKYLPTVAEVASACDEEKALRDALANHETTSAKAEAIQSASTEMYRKKRAALWEKQRARSEEDAAIKVGIKQANGASSMGNAASRVMADLAARKATMEAAE